VQLVRITIKHTGLVRWCGLLCEEACKFNQSEKVLKMVIFGDKSKQVYEIELNRLNILTGKYEKCWDYVHAIDEKDARRNVAWIYGQSIEILNVQLDT